MQGLELAIVATMCVTCLVAGMLWGLKKQTDGAFERLEENMDRLRMQVGEIDRAWAIMSAGLAKVIPAMKRLEEKVKVIEEWVKSPSMVRFQPEVPDLGRGIPIAVGSISKDPDDDTDEFEPMDDEDEDPEYDEERDILQLQTERDGWRAEAKSREEEQNLTLDRLTQVQDELHKAKVQLEIARTESESWRYQFEEEEAKNQQNQTRVQELIRNAASVQSYVEQILDMQQEIADLNGKLKLVHGANLFDYPNDDEPDILTMQRDDCPIGA